MLVDEAYIIKNGDGVISYLGDGELLRDKFTDYVYSSTNITLRAIKLEQAFILDSPVGRSYGLPGSYVVELGKELYAITERAFEAQFSRSTE